MGHLLTVLLEFRRITNAFSYGWFRHVLLRHQLRWRSRCVCWGPCFSASYYSAERRSLWWLLLVHPNGNVDFGSKSPTSLRLDLSARYYLPQAHNVGVSVDGSGHYHGTDAKSAMVWLVLQYQVSIPITFSPFVRVFVGTANRARRDYQAEWNVALGGGGGFDLNVGHRFAIRLAQVDYIYSNYNSAFSAAMTPSGT